jgi:hypothetical protein
MRAPPQNQRDRNDRNQRNEEKFIPRAPRVYFAKAIEQTLEHILILNLLIQIMGCSKVVGRLI